MDIVFLPLIRKESESNLLISCLWSGKDTSTVILSVKTVLFREADGTKIALSFFEIRRQMLHSVTVRKLFSNLVDPLRIFMGADGKCGSKIICTLLGGQSGRLFHSKTVADPAPSAPFRLMLQALNCRKEKGRIIVAFKKDDILIITCIGYKAFDLIDPLYVFPLRSDVRVVIKNRDLKIGEQIFNNIT